MLTCSSRSQNEWGWGGIHGWSASATVGAFARGNAACASKRKRSSTLRINWTFAQSSKPELICPFSSACSLAKSSCSSSATSMQEPSPLTTAPKRIRWVQSPATNQQTASWIQTSFTSPVTASKRPMKESKATEFKRISIASYSLEFGSTIKIYRQLPCISMPPM